MEMDEGSRSPSEICSSRAVKSLNSNVLDLAKKRKLQSEEFELPVPKHKCLDRGLTPLIPTLNSNPATYKYFPTDILTEDSEVLVGSKEESQHDSAKDSNSFAEDADSAMSTMHGDAYFDPEHSSSSFYQECLQNKGNSIARVENKQHLSETLEEQLLEFGFDEDYNFFEPGKDFLEKFVGKEVEEEEEDFYPYGVNRSNYILSSGRNTNQETQLVTTKPTIDQEFEEYFSALMM